MGDVLSWRLKSGLAIVLNRPESINSLTETMLDDIHVLLDQVESDPKCRFLLFFSTTVRGFSAGGDMKILAELGARKHYDRVDAFFRKEYGLDLRLHLFPKPVIVIADGITMGGGLGITAGAGIRIATERTRMAMPETRIGFFPDVGSTGWMFDRCPKGYPEYLGLTGYEMKGIDCVRLGFGSHFVKSENLRGIMNVLETIEFQEEKDRKSLERDIIQKIAGWCHDIIPVHTDLDRWVEKYFAGRLDIHDILESLQRCHDHQSQCRAVFDHIAERSPTALVMALKLMRRNERQPIEKVFEAELKAAKYMTRHPDYIEGVRARLVDKDNRPKWRPNRIEWVNLKDFSF
jgi:enoyl-CoA hydratase/carnithine racemase